MGLTEEEKKKHPYFSALKMQEFYEKYGGMADEDQKKFEDMLVNMIVNRCDIAQKEFELNGMDSVIWACGDLIDQFAEFLQHPRERAYLIAKVLKKKYGLKIPVTERVENRTRRNI